MADGQACGAVVLNTANSWFHRWNNLPKYTAQNALITYTVTENAPGYGDHGVVIKSGKQRMGTGFLWKTGRRIVG